MSVKTTYQRFKRTLQDTFQGRPDVIIYGENHTDDAHKTEQEDAIRHYRPEYVLMERLNNEDPEQTKGYNDLYSHVTLREVAAKSDMSLEDLGITEALAKDIRDDTEAEPSRGIVPDTYDELIDTPVFEYNYSTVNKIREAVMQRSQEVAEQDIELGKAIFQTGSYVRKLMTINPRERAAERVYRAGAQVGARFVGCDTDKSELPRMNTDDIDPEDREEYAKRMNEYNQELASYVEGANDEREQTMGRRISEFSRKRNTNRPLVAIVGAEHVKGDSRVHEELRRQGVNYRVIIQKHKSCVEDDIAAGICHAIKLGANY